MQTNYNHNNKQLSFNFPNKLLLKIISSDLPSDQIKCLLFIIFKAQSINNKTSKIIKISLDDFLKNTGIDKKNINTEVNSLIKRKIVFLIDKGLFSINNNTEEWILVDENKSEDIDKNNTNKQTKKRRDNKKINEDLYNLLWAEINSHPDRDSIITFYNYRQNTKIKGKKTPIKTPAGVTRLVNEIKRCKKAQLNIAKCVELAMEYEWLSLNPSYFKNFPETQNQLTKPSNIFINNYQKNTSNVQSAPTLTKNTDGSKVLTPEEIRARRMQ